MTCSSPFKRVNNIGCVHLYIKNEHRYAEGLAYCQSLGGELFEFTDFDTQYQDVLDYLIANGGKSLLLLVIRSHPIHLSTASITDVYKDDIWIGLRRAQNGNYYWPISGKQLEHREEKNIWYKGDPIGQDCVFMDLVDAKHVKNSFWDYSCTSSHDISFCQIPFV